jgi:acyl-CoA synthetase (AMP-forming)/AMP-acid ligase II
LVKSSFDISYLYITGRSKEIINKGGEVISPFEIEEAIITAAKDRVKVSFSPVRLAIPYLLLNRQR